KAKRRPTAGFEAWTPHIVAADAGYRQSCPADLHFVQFSKTDGGHGHYSHRGAGTAAGSAVRGGRGAACGGEQSFAAAVEQRGIRVAGWRRQHGDLGGESGPIRTGGGGC